MKKTVAKTAPPKSVAKPWFGPQLAGRRKVARPFTANEIVEARLNARRARGPWRLDRPGNAVRIKRIVSGEARRSRVRVRKVRVGATSLEFELSASRREDLSLFFRAVAGRVPRAVTGSERGRPLPVRKTPSSSRQFWDGLVATRPK